MPSSRLSYPTITLQSSQIEFAKKVEENRIKVDLFIRAIEIDIVNIYRHRFDVGRKSHQITLLIVS